MSRRGPVGLGDVIRAVRACGRGDDAAVGDATALLGWEIRRAPTVGGDAGTARVPPPREVARRDDERPRPPDPRPERKETTSRPSVNIAPLTTSPIERTAVSPLGVGGAGVPAVPGPPDPLIEPVRTRSVVSAMAGVRTPDGAIDTRACVDVLARGRRLERIPRRLRPTLRRGVRVLVGRADGLAPYQDDVDALVDDLRRWVGADGVGVAWFHGVPDHVVDADGAESAWAPVPDGPVAVVLAAPGAPEAAWRAVATRVERAPWVILSPFPPARWGALAGILPIVPWDRPLTAAHVLAARSLR